MQNLWAVTAIAHPALRDVSDDCQQCLFLSDAAITHARVTGSVGCTFSDGGHSCTVARAIRVIDDSVDAGVTYSRTSFDPIDGFPY